MKIDATGNTAAISKIVENTNRGKTGGDFQKLVRQAQEEKDDNKLREACREIEAIFIHQMLRQMRATVPTGGLLQESTATAIYRDMLDEEYSRLMARTPGSLGLANILYDDLKGKQGNTETTGE